MYCQIGARKAAGLGMGERSTHRMPASSRLAEDDKTMPRSAKRIFPPQISDLILVEIFLRPAAAIPMRAHDAKQILEK
jgi:hypothetical protein